MKDTWSDPRRMAELLGVEGSEEAYKKLLDAVANLELSLSKGNVSASLDPHFQLAGVKIELHFLDFSTRFIYRYDIEADFKGKSNDNSGI